MNQEVLVQIDYEGKTYYLSDETVTRKNIYYPYLSSTPSLSIGGEGYAKVNSGQISLFRDERDENHPFSGSRYYSLLSTQQEIRFRMYLGGEENPIFVGNLSLDGVTDQEISFLIVEEIFTRKLTDLVLAEESKTKIDKYYLLRIEGEDDIANFRIMVGSPYFELSDQTEVIFEREYKNQSMRYEMEPLLKLEYEKKRDNRYLTAAGDSTLKRLLFTEIEDQSSYLTVGSLLNYTRSGTQSAIKRYSDVAQIMEYWGFTPKAITDANGNIIYYTLNDGDDSPLNNTYEYRVYSSSDDTVGQKVYGYEELAGNYTNCKIYEFPAGSLNGQEYEYTYYVGSPVNNPFSFGEITLRDPVIIHGNVELEKSEESYPKSNEAEQYHPVSVDAHVTVDQFEVFEAKPSQSYHPEVPATTRTEVNKVEKAVHEIKEFEIYDLNLNRWVLPTIGRVFKKYRYKMSDSVNGNDEWKFRDAEAARYQENNPTTAINADYSTIELRNNFDLTYWAKQASEYNNDSILPHGWNYEFDLDDWNSHFSSFRVNSTKFYYLEAVKIQVGSSVPRFDLIFYVRSVNGKRTRFMSLNEKTVAEDFYNKLGSSTHPVGTGQKYKFVADSWNEVRFNIFSENDTYGSNIEIEFELISEFFPNSVDSRRYFHIGNFRMNQSTGTYTSDFSEDKLPDNRFNYEEAARSCHSLTYDSSVQSSYWELERDYEVVERLLDEGYENTSSLKNLYQRRLKQDLSYETSVFHQATPDSNGNFIPQLTRLDPTWTSVSSLESSHNISELTSSYNPNLDYSQIDFYKSDLFQGTAQETWFFYDKNAGTYHSIEYEFDAEPERIYPSHPDHALPYASYTTSSKYYGPTYKMTMLVFSRSWATLYARAPDGGQGCWVCNYSFQSSYFDQIPTGNSANGFLVEFPGNWETSHPDFSSLSHCSLKIRIGLFCQKVESQYYYLVSDVEYSHQSGEHWAPQINLSDYENDFMLKPWLGNLKATSYYYAQNKKNEFYWQGNIFATSTGDTGYAVRDPSLHPNNFFHTVNSSSQLLPDSTVNDGLNAIVNHLEYRDNEDLGWEVTVTNNVMKAIKKYKCYLALRFSLDTLFFWTLKKFFLEAKLIKDKAKFNAYVQGILTNSYDLEDSNCFNMNDNKFDKSWSRIREPAEEEILQTFKMDASNEIGNACLEKRVFPMVLNEYRKAGYYIDYTTLTKDHSFDTAFDNQQGVHEQFDSEEYYQFEINKNEPSSLNFDAYAINGEQWFSRTFDSSLWHNGPKYGLTLYSPLDSALSSNTTRKLILIYRTVNGQNRMVSIEDDIYVKHLSSALFSYTSIPYQVDYEDENGITPLDFEIEIGNEINRSDLGMNGSPIRFFHILSVQNKGTVLSNDIEPDANFDYNTELKQYYSQNIGVIKVFKNELKTVNIPKVDEIPFINETLSYSYEQSRTGTYSESEAEAIDKGTDNIGYPTNSHEDDAMNLGWADGISMATNKETYRVHTKSTVLFNYSGPREYYKKIKIEIAPEYIPNPSTTSLLDEDNYWRIYPDSWGQDIIELKHNGFLLHSRAYSSSDSTSDNKDSFYEIEGHGLPYYYRDPQNDGPVITNFDFKRTTYEDRHGTIHYYEWKVDNSGNYQSNSIIWSDASVITLTEADLTPPHLNDNFEWVTEPKNTTYFANGKYKILEIRRGQKFDDNLSTERYGVVFVLENGERRYSIDMQNTVESKRYDNDEYLLELWIEDKLINSKRYQYSYPSSKIWSRVDTDSGEGPFYRNGEFYNLFMFPDSVGSEVLTHSTPTESYHEIIAKKLVRDQEFLGNYYISQMYEFNDSGSTFLKESFDKTEITLDNDSLLITSDTTSSPQLFYFNQLSQSTSFINDIYGGDSSISSSLYRIYRSDSATTEAKPICFVKKHINPLIVSDITYSDYMNTNGETYYEAKFKVSNLDLEFDADGLCTYMNLECYNKSHIWDISFFDSDGDLLPKGSVQYPDATALNKEKSFFERPIPFNTDSIEFVVRNEEEDFGYKSNSIRAFDLFVYQRVYPIIGDTAIGIKRYAVSRCVNFFDKRDPDNLDHKHIQFIKTPDFMDLFYETASNIWVHDTDKVSAFAIRNPNLQVGHKAEYNFRTGQNKWTPRVYDEGLEVGVKISANDETAPSKVFIEDSDSNFIYLAQKNVGQVALTGRSKNGFNLYDFFDFIVRKLNEEKEDEKANNLLEGINLNPISFENDVDFEMTDRVNGVTLDNIPIYQDSDITYFELAEEVAKKTNHQFFFSYTSDDSSVITRKMVVVDVIHVFENESSIMHLTDKEIISISMDFPFPAKAYEGSLTRNVTYTGDLSQNRNSLMKSVTSKFRIDGSGVGTVQNFEVLGESFAECKKWLARFSKINGLPKISITISGIYSNEIFGKKISFTDSIRLVSGFFIVQGIEYNFKESNTRLEGVVKFEEIIYS